MPTQPTIVLHWYPPSPFANKIAWILNYKQVEYKTVLIKMIEPRPLRRPLDAGYRKTPILQIGNQVFCDTKAIIEELEARFPSPPLFPKTRHGESTTNSSWGLSWYLETSLFLAVPTQFNLDLMPAALLEDRAKFAGKEFDADAFRARQAFLKVELEAQIRQIYKNLPALRNDGSADWVLGTDTPTGADFSLGMITLFLQNIIGPDFVEQKYPALLKHFEKVAEAGKHELTAELPELDAADALTIAKQEQSTVVPLLENGKDLFKIGQKVTVTPTDSGRAAAIGELVVLTDSRVTIKHQDDRTGVVYTHFPLVNYVVAPAPAARM
ncbi:hypothetical protein BC940DRAFT_370807 [Gongronella butleri]|nr:hypothetical protein BC940DRAFT_370807 [Gongronella butleri]